MTLAGLACFDFDWSLIDTDSDRFVMEQLSPELRQRLNNSTIQWTDLQNECLKEFHDQGGSGQVIRDALTKVPLDPHMIQVCQLLFDSGWKLIIVSDANAVYIEGILEHYKIRHLFSTIITNPAYWDEQDRLHIQRLVPADAPHGCPNGICSLNICKGQEVDKLIEHLGERTGTRMMYVGDGTNDYCPALRMESSEDTLFVRKGRSLEGFLARSESAIRGRISYWALAGDILRALQSEPGMVQL
ncbi:phosphatase phospho-type [Mortierella sp. GBAus27b]|nr:phosphatase phospho-type [Mortierella sp. GBAus27b]